MISELRAERHRLIATLDSLSDEEFAAGPTLCAGWTPREVLGHLIGLDYFLGTYRGVLLGNPLRAGSRINAANDATAARIGRLPRERLMEWAAQWAGHPSATSRIAAPLLLGDLGVHHQDVLRGLGRAREVPDPVATAIFREGLHLSVWLNRRSLRHRLVPTDGGRPVGRRGSPEVRGTREALGLWLTGRDGVAPELTFG
ncbi:MAG: maleylpyruvate isomerase family mycothiol-dependent enzyme [Streptosporangiaceae bacterium]